MVNRWKGRCAENLDETSESERHFANRMLLAELVANNETDCAHELRL